jgi:salicylate hydroxylase
MRLRSKYSSLECARLRENGLQVLAKIPGLSEYINGYPREDWEFYSVLPEDKGFLGGMSHPKREDAPDAPGAIATRRHALQQQLNDFAGKLGVPVRWAHELKSLEQDDEGVSVTFANGVEERFSFVVGCDGLHSNTRKSLFGEQPADYTGVATVRGCKL